MTGSLLTKELALEKYEIDEAYFAKNIKNAAVIHALEERGITIRESLDAAEKWRNHGLSPRQLIVADTMLDLLDSRSDKKKLQDLGVSTREWRSWLAQPGFAQYLDENTQQLLKHGQHEAALALMDRVRAGDLKAIAYLHEYTGRFSQRKTDQSTTVNLTPTNNIQVNQIAVDVQGVLNDILEVIVQEVDDPSLGARIADGIKSVMVKRRLNGDNPGVIVQGQLEQDAKDIRVPEIATAREITPEIERLMSRGVGTE